MLRGLAQGGAKKVKLLTKIAKKTYETFRCVDFTKF